MYRFHRKYQIVREERTAKRAREWPNKCFKMIIKKRKHIKLIHEGEYVAKVDIELIDIDIGWPPYLSLEDAQKLDDVR